MTDVSVLLSVHNGLPYLVDAVNSVLSQTGPTFELIIIDDGSTDGSDAWLNTLSVKDGRVRVVHNDVARGLTHCLNQALQMTRGKYIARIDHDDLWLSDKLAKQIDAFKYNNKLVLVATAYLEEDLIRSWQRLSLIPLCFTDIEIRQALYRFNPFFHSSIMFKREVFETIGGYNETYRYAQDYEMWTRILRCGQGCTLPDTLCVRRLGNENISIRKERAQRFNAMRAKFTWCASNGFSYKVIIPVIRDLIVICLPNWLKLVVRKQVRRDHSS